MTSFPTTGIWTNFSGITSGTYVSTWDSTLVGATNVIPCEGGSLTAKSNNGPVYPKSDVTSTWAGNGNYYNGATWADAESWATVGTAAYGRYYAWVRGANEVVGGGNVSGYAVQYTIAVNVITATLQIGYWTSVGAFSGIGSVITVGNCANGDSYGICVVGSTVTSFMNYASTGVWTQIDQLTNTSITAAGHIGWGVADVNGSTTISAFGGGPSYEPRGPDVNFCDPATF